VCAAYVLHSVHREACLDTSLSTVTNRDEKALRDLQSLHREHCQSFMRRIHYLKARVTREAGFRDDLIYQKQHLLRTIGCFEKTYVLKHAFCCRKLSITTLR
jgi:hypothetical protein